jgi:SAM-dependent methyltransferase
MSSRCPVCEGTAHVDRFRGFTAAEVAADTFRPSAEHFGATAGKVVRCLVCGHAWVARPVAEEDLMSAYEGAADEVSVREEEGQVATADRALRLIEKLAAPGRAVDLGCWTGSFLVAAKNRGWDGVGIEPSQWGSERARQRGIEVLNRDLFENGLEPGAYRLVVLCDVIEHVTNPRAALAAIRNLLEPGGVVYMTLPNAGSAVARVLGRRWWSVLPMHLQYFTPRSLRLALELEDFQVRTMRSHAKVFSMRYYAERLGGYSEALGSAAVAVVETARLADRMVGPDFRDRLAVIATV